MFARVPYTSIAGRHRPYLEVVFNNSINNTYSSKTFAMVDSGADHTVIPYSIGLAIGLAEPTEEEKVAAVSGIGGNLSYIKRDCRIHLANRTKNEIYTFQETVWWIYPDEATKILQSELIKKHQEFNRFKGMSFPDTELHQYFQEQMSKTENELNDVNNRLEVNVLLGRPFFDNFEFIQFFHKDRNKEDKCYFNYKVAPGKIVETVPIPSQQIIQTATSK